MNSKIFNLLWRGFLLFFVVGTIFSGCASISNRTNIIAVVEDEPITIGDLEYALQIEHRREDLSSARKLDISKYVEKLIEEKLLIHEAMRMGMENSPDIQAKIEAYILRESVNKLYNEEIIKKVVVTDDEVKEYYKSKYELFTLITIGLDSEKEALDVLKKIESGTDLGEIVLKQSSNLSHKGNGEVIVTRSSLGFLENIVVDMKPGETSGIIKEKQKYYLVKFMKRQEASSEEFEKVREGLERRISSMKTELRSNEYLKELREKSGVKINRDALDSINFKNGDGARENLIKDEQTLAELNGMILTVGGLVSMLPQNTSMGKENKLNSWINMKVVDAEALARHYEDKTGLKEMLARYKDQVLKNSFINKVIVQGIKITEKDMESYYKENKNDFLEPVSYKIQQVSVKTIDEINDVLKSLQSGANFSWLASAKSVDSYAQDGGNVGWVRKVDLPEGAVQIIDNMAPGDITPVIESGSFFMLIRMEEKTGEEFEDFHRVKIVVYKKIFGERYRELYKKYVDELKQTSDIVVYNKAVREIEERLRN